MWSKSQVSGSRGRCRHRSSERIGSRRQAGSVYRDRQDCERLGNVVQDGAHTGWDVYDGQPRQRAQSCREVRLDPFYLCWTETTIDLFMAYYQETVSAKRDFMETQEAKKDAEQADDVDAISGPTPVYGDLSMGYGPRHPAIGMTWHNANNFCLWLSRKTGKKYRLPTEAEWEYACRAGKADIFGATGDPEKMKDYAWYEATADSETSEVGKKKRNPFGLYDIAGNVREWVSDFYSPTAYAEAAKKNPAVNPEAAKKNPAVNPKGPKTGELHVARGGDYSSPIGELRCAARHLEQKWWRMGDPQIPKSIWWLPEMDIIGFRVARSIEDERK